MLIKDIEPGIRVFFIFDSGVLEGVIEQQQDGVKNIRIAYLEYDLNKGEASKEYYLMEIKNYQIPAFRTQKKARKALKRKMRGER